MDHIQSPQPWGFHSRVSKSSLELCSVSGCRCIVHASSDSSWPARSPSDSVPMIHWAVTFLTKITTASYFSTGSGIVDLYESEGIRRNSHKLCMYCRVAQAKDNGSRETWWNIDNAKFVYSYLTKRLTRSAKTPSFLMSGIRVIQYDWSNTKYATAKNGTQANVQACGRVKLFQRLDN